MNNDSESAISPRLTENLDRIKALYADSYDVVFHHLQCGEKAAAVIYLTGLTDSDQLNQFVLELSAAKDEGPRGGTWRIMRMFARIVVRQDSNV